MKGHIKTIIALSILSMSVAFSQNVSSVKLDRLEPIKMKQNDKDFRIQKFNKALAEHEKDKPLEWNLWVEKVKEQKDEYDMVSIATVLVNQIPYLDNTDGSYMTPEIALNRGGVVCKDFAMMKYLLLRDAGFDTDKLGLMIHDTTSNPSKPLAHVVLIAVIDDKVFVSNQYSATTQNSYFNSLKIHKDKFIKSIKKLGMDALNMDFDTSSQWIKTALYPIEKYNHKNKKLYDVINENGKIKM